MTEDGNEVLMAGDTEKVFDKSGNLLMSVKWTQNWLYQINLKTIKPVCLLAIIEDPALLWHVRLGHVNFHDLRLLGEKEMEVGMPLLIHPN